MTSDSSDSNLPDKYDEDSDATISAYSSNVDSGSCSLVGGVAAPGGHTPGDLAETRRGGARRRVTRSTQLQPITVGTRFGGKGGRMARGKMEEMQGMGRRSLRSSQARRIVSKVWRCGIRIWEGRCFILLGKQLTGLGLRGTV